MAYGWHHRINISIQGIVMGKVWILRSDGKRCHLPVQGEADVNTPATAIDVSMVQAVAINRCYCQPIAINHPTFGQFTIDLCPSGITGECVQCGHCCTHLVENCPDPENCAWPYREDIDCHACPNLIVKNPKKFPQAGNTTCSIYENILDQHKECAYPPDIINPLWINCGYGLEQGE